jgi:hypothetical protein
LNHRFAPYVWHGDDFGVHDPDTGAVRPPPLSLSELIDATSTAVADPSALSAVAPSSFKPRDIAIG